MQGADNASSCGYSILSQAYVITPYMDKKAQSLGLFLSPTFAFFGVEIRDHNCEGPMMYFLFQPRVNVSPLRYMILSQLVCDLCFCLVKHFTQRFSAFFVFRRDRFVFKISTSRMSVNLPYRFRALRH